MDVIRLLDRLYDAYNRHDATAVARLYDAAATHEEIAQGQIRRGAEAIAEGLRRFFTWFPDAHWQPQTKLVDPSLGQAAATYFLTATLQARMGPFLPSGQRIALRGVHVLHLEGGRIARSEDFWDAATFQNQLNGKNKEERR